MRNIPVVMLLAALSLLLALPASQGCKACGSCSFPFGCKGCSGSNQVCNGCPCEGGPEFTPVTAGMTILGLAGVAYLVRRRFSRPAQ